MSPQPRRPYRVSPQDPGSAAVVKHVTDERLGYLLQGFYGRWVPYCEEYPGKALCIGVSRATAAAVVWDHHHRKGCQCGLLRRLDEESAKFGALA